MASGVSFAGSTGDASELPVARVRRRRVSFCAAAFWYGRRIRKGIPGQRLTTSKRRAFLYAAQHLVHAEARHLLEFGN